MAVSRVFFIESISKISFTLVVLCAPSFSSIISVCKNCHGKNFEKRALGRSKIVRNMSKKEIIKALESFKKSKSNSIMKGFASRLSDKQIKQIGKVIGK